GIHARQVAPCDSWRGRTLDRPDRPCGLSGATSRTLPRVEWAGLRTFPVGDYTGRRTLLRNSIMATTRAQGIVDNKARVREAAGRPIDRTDRPHLRRRRMSR